MDFSSKENFRFFVYFLLKNRKSLILQGNIYVLLCSCERRKIMVTKILDGQNALDFCLKNGIQLIMKTLLRLILMILKIIYRIFTFGFKYGII